MLRLDDENLLLGGFHEHWSRWDERNPALLLAALNYYHFDFVTLMCGPAEDALHRATAARLSDRIRIYPGREEFLGWGHVVTVNPRAPRRPDADNPDYEAVLRSLGETSDLVILAHPEMLETREKLVLTREMDRLLEAGVLHGINLVNSAGFDAPGRRELISWFQRRDAEGRRTPIASGWDAHLVRPVPEHSTVLYSPQRPPVGHIENAGTNRTILFCAENTLPAIVEAFREGRTVIEDMVTGELVGPAPLLRFLSTHGYRERMADLDRRRDTTRLCVPAPWIARKDGPFSLVPQPQEAGYEILAAVPTPDGLEDAVLIPDAGGAGAYRVNWAQTPSSRDVDHATVVLRHDGGERIWAVETQHPIQMRVLPCYHQKEPGVEIVPQRPFAGNFSIKIGSTFSWSGRLEKPLWLALPAVLADTVQSACFRAISDAGLERTEEAVLTFLTASRFTGDWAGIPVHGVDCAEFVPPGYVYGAARPYPGPDVYAAYYQFAWDKDAFHWRARVRDAIHFQPNTDGSVLYNADCLQMGIDPLLRRCETMGHVYTFNFALTPQGPLLFRAFTPDGETGEKDVFQAPPPNQALPDGCLRITPCEGGLIYEASLPWRELAPVRPQHGTRLGIYCIAFNNDGEGLIDTLHWPVPIAGIWLCPRKWSVLSLLP